MQIRRGKAFVGDTVDGDTIVVNIDTGVFYSLTTPAGELWDRAAEAGFTVSTEPEETLVALLVEGILQAEPAAQFPEQVESTVAFERYEEMADILRADPIHEVGEDGWPVLK